MSIAVQRETFAAPDTAIEHRDDGSVIVRSRHQLPSYEHSIPVVLRKRAEAHPNLSLIHI